LIIDEAEDLPSSSTYSARFGSLARAYQLVGFTPDRDFRYIEINRILRRLQPEIIAATIEQITRVGGTVAHDSETELLTVNDEFTVSVCLVRCQETAAGTFRWHIRFDTSLNPDVIVALRMAPDNQAVQDYYILPRIELPGPDVRLGEHNGLALDAFRFESLDQLYDMAARASLGEVL
jgi:hypothetical protein